MTFFSSFPNYLPLTVSPSSSCDGLRKFVDSSSPVNRAISSVLNDNQLSLHARQLRVESIVNSSWQDLFGVNKVDNSNYYLGLNAFYIQFNNVFDTALTNLKKGRSPNIKMFLTLNRAHLIGIVFQVLFKIFNSEIEAPYTNVCCDIGGKIIKAYIIQEYLAIPKNERVDWKIYYKEYYKTKIEMTELELAAEIGSLLIEVVLSSGDFLKRSVVRKSRDNTVLVLIPSAEAIKLFKSESSYIGTNLPMIVEPIKWSDDMSFGGYLSNNVNGFKPLIHQHIQNRDNPTYENLWTVVENKELICGMVNQMQSVAFRINKNVLAWLMSNGFNTGLLLHEDVCQLNNIKADSELYLKYCLQRNILGIANLFSSFNRLYFPLYLDWRGRLYTDTEYLSFQGCSLSKALLEFSVGGILKKSSNEELKYFKIYGANCYGLGNKSYDERIKWCDDHFEEIINVSHDLIKSSDEPFLFLAFCLEYKNMIDCWNKGENFKTHLPIQLDASCNGLQHLSCIVADTGLAKRVNIVANVSSIDPNDLYNECVDLVKYAIAKKVESYPIYSNLTDLIINRSIIKRSIMTIPYNVTPTGIMNQLEDFFTKNWSSHKKNYEYKPKKPETHGNVTLNSTDIMCLATIIHQILYKEHPKLKALVEYWDSMVKLLTRLNLPVVWLTPGGLQIKQNYRAVKSVKFRNSLYKNAKVITLQIPLDKLDSKRQRSGIIPNLIHSLDASVIALVSKAFLNENINNYFTIHDCFAATTDNIPLMTLLVREAFIGIYADNRYIQGLHDFIIKYIGLHYKVHILDGLQCVYFDEECLKVPSFPQFVEEDLPSWSRFPELIKNAIYMIH